MALTAKSRLGPYEILAKLGAGGMGEVYRALDTRLEREVAIKVLPAQMANDALALARFHREIRAIAGLSHPNVVAIYDVGTEDGRIFAVMELLRGQTLGKRLSQGPLEWPEAVKWAAAIADGLGAAHAMKIIHRDIKPENIFLTTHGGLKILDFGLARVDRIMPGKPADDAGPKVDTEPGMVMGTVLYMSPEQVRGQTADARSDIFALGCVTFEMLNGSAPFKAETAADTMAAILHEPASRLSGAGRMGPPELEAIVLKCLEKPPHNRFQTANELGKALHELLHDAPPTEAAAPAQEETSLFHETPPPGSQPSVKLPPSVAVLPFRNLSSDPENEYFSDGLAEELINALTRVDGLHVASRTSAFAFKNRNEDIRKIGDQLNVRAVLEGSVRKSGKRLRISAQLVNAADGYHLWSQSYNRELADVFAIQEEIASSIAAALQLILGDNAKKAIEKAAAADVKAYDCYLRGMQLFHQFRRASFEAAESMFLKAIAIDPLYARAYAGVANCHSLLFMYWDPSPRHQTQADEASRKALELDSDLAEAHFSRGLALATNKQYDEAHKEYDTAIRLDPDLFEAHYYFGSACLADGKLEDAARLLEKAHKLRPEDYQALAHLSTIYTSMGRPADVQRVCHLALDTMEKHLALHPDDARALYLGATCWCRLEQAEKALEWAGRALAIDPEEPVTLYNLACVYALQGQIEKALDCLEGAVKHGFTDKTWIENDADLKSLQAQPRFVSLLQSL